MDYIYTTEEAQPIANYVRLYLEKRKFEVRTEVALNADAPCRTTLLSQERNGLSILVEAQRRPKIDGSLRALASWFQRERSYCELYVATMEDSNFSGIFLQELENLWAGLILVDDNGNITINREPKNPALFISPDPTLKFGVYRDPIRNAKAKFNAPSSILTNSDPRKDGLRDMCEIVEKLTEELALLTMRKGLLNATEKEIEKMKWSNQVDVLSSRKRYTSGSPIINAQLKRDLDSFTGGRNLFSHKARNRTEEINRQRQAADRMMLGPRLAAQLVSLKSRVNRKR